MKRFVFILWSFLGALHSQAQWSPVQSGTNNPVYHMQMVNANIGYFADEAGMYKTTNGGFNWSKLYCSPAQFDSLFYISVEKFSLYCTDTLTCIAVGFSAISAKPVILRTTNGGSIWTTSYLGTAIGVSMRDVWFTNSLNGFAVGDSGTILSTTDGGVNWNPVSSGITNNLIGIRFDPSNASNGLICSSDSLVLSTSNGGLSWTPTTLPGENFYALKFAAPGIAYAAGSGNKLYKTINDGASWDSISNNLPPSSDIFFTSNDTGYACGSAIYRTVNGGVLWEQQQTRLEFQNIVYFYNSLLGFCGGSEEILYRTNNAGGQAWAPIADIAIQGLNRCDSSLFYYQTTSHPGYTYQWELNGNLISTQYSDSVVSVGNNNYDTLSVIVGNGNANDTASVSYYVIGPQEFYLLPLRTYQDTLCSGQIPTILVDSTIVNDEYELYDSSGNMIGDPQSGTYGTLAFSPGIINKTSTYTIVVERNTICLPNQLSRSITFVIDTPLPVTVLVNTPGVCLRDTAKIELLNSQPGVTYSINIGLNNPNATVIGTGGPVYFTFPPGYTASYNIEAQNALGCVSTFNNVATVNVGILVVDVSLNENVFVGQNIDLLNTSYGGSFSWIFDSTATLPADTAYQPSAISYSTTGQKVIKLTVTNVDGCIDSAAYRVRVYQPINTNAPGTVCLFDTISSLNEYRYLQHQVITAYHVDRFGNQYVAGTHYINGDGADYNGAFYYVLQKFNPQGQLVWQKTQDDNTYQNANLVDYFSCFITGISSDPQGNIYVCGSYGASTLIFDSAIVINNGWPTVNSYVAKFDTTGKLQWFTSSANQEIGGGNANYTGATDILYIDDHHIYVSVFGHAFVDSLIEPDNTVVPVVVGEGLGGPSGFVMQLNSLGFLQKDFAVGDIDGNDNNMDYLNPSYESWSDYWNITESPKMHLCADGRIMLAGFCLRYIEFGDTMLVTDTLHGSEFGGYISYIDTATGWDGAYLAYGLADGYNVNYGYPVTPWDKLPVACVDGGDNLYFIAPYLDTLNLPSGQVFADTTSVNYILKYSPRGKLLWQVPAYGSQINGIAVSDNNDSIYIFGDYKPFFGMSSASGLEGFPAAGYNGAYLAALDSSGNIAWFENFSCDSSVYSYFMQKGCGGALNCVGVAGSPGLPSGGPVTIKNNTIQPDKIANFILRYDPTNHNCQPQICPADMGIYKTVYDTILVRDSAAYSNHVFIRDSVTLYGNIHSTDTVYILDTIIQTGPVNHTDSVSYSNVYHSYDPNLAIYYTFYTDSVVYTDSVILAGDTTYIDTMRIINTIVAGLPVINAANGLKLSVYPNPFNNATNVSYYIPENTQVSIALYDNLGRKVKSLFDGEQSTRNYSLTISATGLSAGVYQLMFTAGDKTIMQKVVYLKRE